MSEMFKKKCARLSPNDGRSTDDMWGKEQMVQEMMRYPYTLQVHFFFSDLHVFRTMPLAGAPWGLPRHADRAEVPEFKAHGV